MNVRSARNLQIIVQAPESERWLENSKNDWLDINLSCRSGRVRDGLQHCVDVVDSIHVDRQAGHPLMGYRAHLKPTQSIEPTEKNMLAWLI